MLQRKIVPKNIIIPMRQDRISHLHAQPREKELRRRAFETVKMATTERFFTDDDLDCSFSFLQVWHSDTLLLSSRAYTDQKTISAVISPDSESDYLLEELDSTRSYVFLDRLVIDAENTSFQFNRPLVFRRFYDQVISKFKQHDIILMARSEPNERLLTKYIRLGFHVIGKKTHHNIPHYIIILKHKERFNTLKQSTLTYFYLRFKNLF